VDGLGRPPKFPHEKKIPKKPTASIIKFISPDDIQFFGEEWKLALPKEVLKNRLNNEIQQCIKNLTHDIEVKDPEFSEFPVTVLVTMKDIPGPQLKDNKIVHKYDHRIRIDISKEYPYRKPTVRFLSDIFHPNIVPPERGGWVCIKLLDNWDPSSILSVLLKGVETLLTNPNPQSPYKDETTIKAAKYFLKNHYTPPNIIHKN
jgi:ubiquitin-protein ligase